MAGAAGALLSVMALLGFSAGSGSAEASAAPSFSLLLLDGGHVSNADLLGRVVVINVWASWCPPCREEAPILRHAYEQANPNKVAFLGVIRNDSRDRAQAFIEQNGLNYPNAFVDDKFMRAFDVRSIPTTFVLDGHGQVAARYFGPIGESRLAALIADAEARTGLGTNPPAP